MRREEAGRGKERWGDVRRGEETRIRDRRGKHLSLIHISEPTRPY